jgi:hypothetical protein
MVSYGSPENKSAGLGLWRGHQLPSKQSKLAKNEYFLHKMDNKKVRIYAQKY